MDPNSLYLNSLRNALQGNLHEAQNAYERAELLKEAMGLDYSEPANEDLPFLENALTTLLSSYDFTRCVRPDGSVYGTRGKCKKGSEGAKGFAPDQFPRKGKEELKNQLIDMKYELARAKDKVLSATSGSARKKAKTELQNLERRRLKLLKEYKGWEH